MQRKFIRAISVVLLLLSVSVFGGCDGGDSSKVKVAISDSDKDSVADIYDDFPYDASRYAFSVCDQAKSMGSNNSIESALGKDSPFSAPYTFVGTTNIANSDGAADMDHFAVQLTGGHAYSLAFYDPDDRCGRAVTFVPDVRIYTGKKVDVMAAGGASYDILSSDEVTVIESGVTLPTLISIDETLPISLDVKAEEATGAIIISFVAAESGTYYVAVGNSDNGASASHRYRFDLLEGNLASAATTQIKAMDGNDYYYTYEDLLLLRYIMEPYVAEETKDGYPTFFKEGAAEAWRDALSYVSAYKETGENADKTSLEPAITGLRWDEDSYHLAYGIDAPTGMLSNHLQAVSGFELTKGQPTRTTTDLTFINKDEEHAHELNANISAKHTFGIFAPTYNASVGYGENIKYSENETTLLLKFEMKETTHRVLMPDEYHLTPTASKDLAEMGADKFREKYGDYFIAGAKYGASYIGTISIKAASSEQIRKIEGELSKMSFIGTHKTSAEFAAKFKELTQSCSIKMHRETMGGQLGSNDEEPTSIEQMLNDMNAFIKNCKADNLAALEAYLMRYNQIPDCAAISDEINVDPKIFRTVVHMTQDYLGLTVRAKLISEMAPADMKDNTVQTAYATEFNALKEDIFDNMKKISSSVASVDEYSRKVSDMKVKFSNLVERYSFYKKLNVQANGLPSYSKSKYVAGGFQDYTLSVAVHDDIAKKTFKDCYEHSYKIGWLRWYPCWRPGDNKRICYISLEDKNGDHWKDDNYPSLGYTWYKFFFKSGYDRGAWWYIQAKYIDLRRGEGSPENYPFAWRDM